MENYFDFGSERRYNKRIGGRARPTALLNEIKWRKVNLCILFFRNLAIIILSAKFFGLVARKCKAPQVVGEIIAGLIIGPCLLNLVQTSDTISIFAEIGVVLLMFTTGLGTNLKELIKAGPIATLIACVGVAVPLAGGTLLYSVFYGFSAWAARSSTGPSSSAPS